MKAKLAFISALVWAFSLFLADFFDTMGTLVGVGKQAGYLNEDGELPELKKPLLVDQNGREPRRSRPDWSDPGYLPGQR